jgi:hypothetical protein
MCVPGRPPPIASAAGRTISRMRWRCEDQSESRSQSDLQCFCHYTSLSTTRTRAVAAFGLVDAKGLPIDEGEGLLPTSLVNGQNSTLVNVKGVDINQMIDAN